MAKKKRLVPIPNPELNLKLQKIKEENKLNPDKIKKVVNNALHDRKKTLSQLEKDYIKARMGGRTQKEAAKIVLPNAKDLTDKQLVTKGGNIERKRSVKRTFNSILVKAGITKDLIARKIMEGMDATSMQGQGKYSEILPDYNARHKYITTAIELKGLKPKEELAHTYDPLTTKLLEMNIDQLKRIVGTSVIDGEVVEDIPEIKVLTITDKHDRS